MRPSPVARLAFLLALLNALSACTFPPFQKEQTSSQAPAALAVRAYLDARVAGDLERAYTLLSARAAAAVSRDQYIQTYKDAPRILSYGQIEAPTDEAAGWARVRVRNVRYSDRYTGNLTFTVVSEESGFKLALDTPLNAALRASSNRSRWDESVKLTDEMLKINPYSVNAYVERAIALRELGREQEALGAYQQAERFAPDDDLAEILVGKARIFMDRGEYGPAAEQMERGLDLVARFPQNYELYWVLAARVDLVKIYLAKGDSPRAYDLAEKLQRAYATDVGVREIIPAMERNPYQARGATATYRLFSVSSLTLTFDLPRDWQVRVFERSGWYASDPAAPDGQPDFGVRFYHEKAVPAAEEMAAQIAAEYESVISQSKSIRVSGQQALQARLGTGRTLLVVHGKRDWLVFEWSGRPGTESAQEAWFSSLKLN